MYCIYLKYCGCIVYILYIVDDIDQAAHGISLFLVDSNLPGFHKGSKLKKLGLKGQVEITCGRIFCSTRQVIVVFTC